MHFTTSALIHGYSAWRTGRRPENGPRNDYRANGSALEQVASRTAPEYRQRFTEPEDGVQIGLLRQLTMASLDSRRTPAEYLGIAPGTLRNWLSARRIAYVKVGRLTRLSKRDLDAFIAAHRVHAANANLGVAWDTESGDESL